MVPVDVNKTEEAKKDLPEHIKRVVALIPLGSERPITVKEICKLTGFNSTTVRHYVATAIVTHQIPIGASNSIGKSGYFVIENHLEREKAINNLTGRIREMSKRVNALKNIPDPNQQKMVI